MSTVGLSGHCQTLIPSGMASAPASGDDGDSWWAIQLSVDHTGHNEDERARVKGEHPGEENLFNAGPGVRPGGWGKWWWWLPVQLARKPRRLRRGGRERRYALA